MKKRPDIFLIIVVAGSFLFIGSMVFVMLLSFVQSGDFLLQTPLATNQVGLVQIIGPIYDSRQWCEDIDHFRTDKSIHAIVVRIDSPGGGVAASQELYTCIRRARERKPVVVSMGGVAASGGYYAALGADTIVANPGTTTGSIGVIMELTRFGELLDKIGIEMESITSGEFKDAGAPYRDITRSEREYFQGYIDDAYEQFLEALITERGLEEEQARELANGRVYTGRQAQEFGLIDVLGDMHDAEQIAADMAGLTAIRIVEPYHRRSMNWIDLIIDDIGESITRHMESHSIFQYRWTPGGTND